MLGSGFAVCSLLHIVRMYKSDRSLSRKWKVELRITFVLTKFEMLQDRVEALSKFRTQKFYKYYCIGKGNYAGKLVIK